jgi:4-hydroxybenzoyl-CoA thioesterase/acyl-CoA thioester hydrolase
MSQQGIKFSIVQRAYIEDTDAGGIVYHANYLNFMERARTECLRSLGFDKQFIFAQQHIFVVHSLNIDYKRPALLDELLIIEASIMQLKRTSIIFRQNIYRDADVISQATVKIACVDKNTMKPAAIPATMHQVLKQQIPLGEN